MRQAAGRAAGAPAGCGARRRRLSASGVTAGRRAGAARQGVLEAIATLQAGGQAAAQEQQGPQEVASNTFTVREANRQGSADATVTVYEFSDFQ